MHKRFLVVTFGKPFRKVIFTSGTKWHLATSVINALVSWECLKSKKYIKKEKRQVYSKTKSCFGECIPVLGVPLKGGWYVFRLFFKIGLFSAISFKSSRRELSIDVAELRTMLKNERNTYLRFIFIPKTGEAFPKTGVSFSVCLSTALSISVTQSFFFFFFRFVLRVEDDFQNLVYIKLTKEEIFGLK